MLVATSQPEESRVDAHRLRSLVEVILADYAENQVTERFNEVVATLKAWASNSTPEHALAFSAKLDELRETVGQSKIRDLLPLQQQILREIGGEGFTGRNIFDRVDKFNREANTPADALAKIQKFKGEYDTFMAALAQIITNFDNLSIGSHHADEGVEEISIILPDSLTRNELGQFRDLVCDWNRSLGFIQELVLGRREAIKVVSLDRGSLILTIGVAFPVAWATLTLVNKCLDTYKRVVKIKEAQLGVKRLKLQNQKAILDLLAAEEKAETDRAVEQITVQLIQEFESKDLAGRSEPERKTLTTKTVQFFLRQIDHGVKIEILLPPPPEPTEGKAGDADHKKHEAVIREIKGAPEKWRELPRGAKPILQLPEPDLEAIEAKNDG